jgi:hypothetical protein
MRVESNANFVMSLEENCSNGSDFNQETNRLNDSEDAYAKDSGDAYAGEVHVEKKYKPVCVQNAPKCENAHDLVKDTSPHENIPRHDDENFYEDMFYIYAPDPRNRSCTRAYWTDGIEIVRTWDRKRKRWQYDSAACA